MSQGGTPLTGLEMEAYEQITAVAASHPEAQGLSREAVLDAIREVEPTQPEEILDCLLRKGYLYKAQDEIRLT